MANRKGKMAIPDGAVALSRSRDLAAEKRKVFAERYLTNGHIGEEAARFAGYTGSSNTVKAAASRMLKRPEIAAELARRSKAVAKAAEMTTDNWAREVSALAFSRIGELYREDGSLIPIHLLPDRVQAAIASVDVLKDGTLMPKMADKRGALDLMARHLGLFERDNAQRGENVRVIVQLVG